MENNARSVEATTEEVSLTQMPGIKNPLTYAIAGVDRGKREASRREASKRILNRSRKYPYGKPVELPFGMIFPAMGSKDLYYDFQIEGVGTKTLLAELAEDCRSIGIDAVAMAVNDVIRSGAKPVLLSDAIHISRSDKKTVKDLVSGVLNGAETSGCFLASGETGDVPEILHKPMTESGLPFDLMVSCLGLVERDEIIWGEVSEGDVIIGIESSGIHSNGVSLARRVLLKNWGGKYDAFSMPGGLERPLVYELLQPTRIYVKGLIEARKSCGIKAALHITGDGISKFRRLFDFRKEELGIRIDEGFEVMPKVFQLVYDTAAALGTPISLEEMFRTFNMGYGFAVVVEKGSADEAIDSFNNYYPARRIGRVSSDGAISISVLKGSKRKTLVL